MRFAVLDAMEAAYASAGIAEFAVWVHESDGGMIGDLSTRGYASTSRPARWGWRSTSSRSNGPFYLGPPSWSEYVRLLDVPGLFSQASPEPCPHPHGACRR